MVVAIDNQAQSSRAAAPIVKWAGGKGRLLPELMARLPRTHGRYYEPFAGGAALFFRLAPSRAVLGDANGDLIRMYEAVRDRVELVIGLLAVHAHNHCAGHYDQIRHRWNHGAEDNVARAAAFIYLNKTCFNGLWRVNQSGEFNVPMGKYKNPPICNPELLRAASLALRTTSLRAGDYRACVVDAEPGDLVYFDPPYDDTFNAYTTEGTFDQRALAETVDQLVGRGVHVIVSNSDTPLIRELYDGFVVERVKSRNPINSDGAGRGEVTELIITSHPRQSDGRTDSETDRATDRSRDAVLRVRPPADGDAGRVAPLLRAGAADGVVPAAQPRAHQDAQQAARSEGLRGARGGREVMEATVNRPPEQQFFDGMRPADEPNNEEVKQAIYLWLDAKVSQKRAGEEVKEQHAAMLKALADAGIDWHPYLDPFTQKKRRVWIAKEPKAKTSGVPRPAGEPRRGRKKRGGPSREADAEIAGEKTDDKVESRRVPRKSVEKEIDPFGATRDSMSNGHNKASVLDEVEATQGNGQPIPDIAPQTSRSVKRKKKPAKKGKGK